MPEFWKSLRFRLAAWNALVVVLTAIAVLSGVRQGVRWAIIHEMDQILLEDMEEVRLALGTLPTVHLPGLTAELQRKAVGHRQHGWFVRLLDASGAETFSTWNDSAAPAPPLSMAEAGPHSRAGYRLVHRRVASVSHPVAAVQLGANESFVSDEMSHIDRQVLWTTMAAIFAAPLVGYWLAGRAARTVGEITAAAARIRPDQLQERLPVLGNGDELDRLGQTINRLLDRIADSVSEKKDFLAHAAHDLRTPLAAIRSSIDVTLDGQPTSNDFRELLADVMEQCESLEVLVNQLLLLSESEVETLASSAAQVDFSSEVRKSIEMFAGVAESRRITLKSQVEPDLRVLGNRHLLRQIVNNLVDNALKYTPHGGRVQVFLHVRENDAELLVCDSGIGIAAADRPRVFERFFRVDRSRTRDPETHGTGLGLSIVEAVVKSHHGTITCQSEPNQGTTFRVLLPRAAVAPNAPANV